MQDSLKSETITPKTIIEIKVPSLINFSMIGLAFKEILRVRPFHAKKHPLIVKILKEKSKQQQINKNNKKKGGGKTINHTIKSPTYKKINQKNNKTINQVSPQYPSERTHF